MRLLGKASPNGHGMNVTLSYEGGNLLKAPGRVASYMGNSKFYLINDKN
jgi:hypothetical protein